jgi:flagellar protein FliL
MEEEIKKQPEEIIKTVKETTGSSFKPKVLVIGLPIFIVQLVAVYFITANILLSKSSSTVNRDQEEAPTEETADTTVSSNPGEFIYNLDDMIINPAQSNGKMLLLASVGISVSEEAAKKMLEEKQVVIKDAVITVLTGKNVEQLNNIANRDMIKSEIMSSLNTLIPDSGIKNIYFSKFIIQ